MYNTVSLEGVIVNIRNYDEEKHRGIFVIRATDNESKSILKKQIDTEYALVLGHYYNPKKGDYVSLQGYWHEDKKYGWQVRCYHMNPTKIIRQSKNNLTTADIKHLLSERIIKGLNFKDINKLISIHKENTIKALFEAFKQHPSPLSDNFRKELDWSETKFKNLLYNASNAVDLTENSSFLHSLGVDWKRSVQISDYIGHQTKAIVSNEPYRLLDVPGVGFSTADKAAKKLGQDMDDSSRYLHAIKYINNNHLQQGHTVITEKTLTYYLSQMDIKINNIEEFINSISLDNLQSVNLTKFGKAYTSNKQIAQDKVIVDTIKTLNSSQSTLQQAIPDNIKKQYHFLNKEQWDSVKMSLKSPVSILTGGPGTGKTTTLSAIIETNKENKLDIILAAPTGKAARRMSESTGYEAKTIHKLLDYKVDKGFSYNENNKLPTGLYVIDEASMIHQGLLKSFMESLPNDARVLLVGDVDQLPSVGAGNILHDLIDSKTIAITRLKQVQRQAEDSPIISLSQAIIKNNKGMVDDILKQSETDFSSFSLSGDSSLTWIATDEDSLADKTVELYTKLIDKEVNSNKDNNLDFNVQLLTPQKKTDTGIDEINKKIGDHVYKKYLKKNGKYINSFGRYFHENDKIIQIKNNSKNNLSNGDMGFIKEIKQNEQLVTLSFEHGDYDVKFEELKDVQLSYGLTIHKSQGSEFPTILIPLSEKHTNMLTRRLIYTAITRGKEHVILLGNKNTLKKAMDNIKESKRETSLSTLLTEALKKTPEKENTFTPEF